MARLCLHQLSGRRITATQRCSSGGGWRRTRAPVPTRAPQAAGSAAAHHEHLTFPQDLPLFPVKPVGVFIPGMAKTLQLYEPHLLALLDEAMTHPQRLMCIAVMEPYMGDADNQAAAAGSYVGGANCVFSCACLVKVLDARPFLKGQLVRVRGEARLGISGMPQVQPYHRATVYALPDPAPTLRELAALPEAVDRLDDIMRSVQLLASKFRCDETAAIQQAFRYVNETPLVPNIQPVLPSLPTDPPPDAAALLPASSPKRGWEERPEEVDDDLDLQRASRLSFASLQWLPEATAEERFAVLQGRLLAMDAASLPERLELTTAIMDSARASLAARVSLRTMR